MNAAGILEAVAAAVAGSATASLLACVPSLHIYNALAPLLSVSAVAAMPPGLLTPFLCGLLAGWTMNNSVPSILLGAADDSTLFTVLPGQALLRQGRGLEAVRATALGGLGGAVALLAVGGPLAPRAVPVLQNVLRPHYHWMLWCVIAFLLMSEWPKGGTSGQGGWRKLADGWRSTGAGLATFALSGALGFLLMYRSPLPLRAASQNLMPAFAGLFAVPWLLLTVWAGERVPEQRRTAGELPDAWTWLKGVGAGSAGGAFAAVVPGVTGGVGALLAGHATAQNDSRVFLVSQGASKAVYYLGAFLLFFVPDAGLTRGGAAWLLRGVHQADGKAEYAVALAALAVGSAVAFGLALPLARGVIRVERLWGSRLVSAAALAAIVALTAAIAGPAGLAVAAVASAIGLIPLLYGSRRMNCLGVILLPLACNLSGIGPGVAAALGLFR